jgi:hypothetical protein
LLLLVLVLVLDEVGGSVLLLLGVHRRRPGQSGTDMLGALGRPSAPLLLLAVLLMLILLLLEGVVGADVGGSVLALDAAVPTPRARLLLLALDPGAGAGHTCLRHPAGAQGGGEAALLGAHRVLIVGGPVPLQEIDPSKRLAALQVTRGTKKRPGQPEGLVGAGPRQENRGV